MSPYDYNTLNKVASKSGIGNIILWNQNNILLCIIDQNLGNFVSTVFFPHSTAVKAWKLGMSGTLCTGLV